MSSESLKIKLQNMQRCLEHLQENESNKITPYVMNTHYLSLDQVLQNLCISLLSEEELRLLCICCAKYIDCLHILATKLNSYQYSKNNNIIQGLLNILIAAAELLGDLRTDFIEYLAPFIFQRLQNIGPPWFLKILMITFKVCLQHTARKKRHKIFNDNFINFLTLANLICYCGDYSYQATLIEIIFRICSSEQIKQNAGEFFPKSNELKNALLNVQLNNFDVCLRTLQNSINIEYKTIFSIKCISVILDDVAVKKPEGVDMWVDFNIGFNSISFFCDRNCLLLDSFDTNQVDGWETVTVMVDSISSVISSSWKSMDKMNVIGKIICFVLETPCFCVYSSSYKAKEYLKLKVIESLKLKELELNILPQMFGTKYKGTKDPEDFNKVSKLDHSIFKDNNNFHQCSVNFSKNNVLDNKLNNGNMSRSDSRPSLSLFSSPNSSILSNSDSNVDFQNLSRAATNAYYNTYSRNRLNLSSQLIPESAEYSYESSGLKEATYTEELDNLKSSEISTETAKNKTSILENYFNGCVKSNTCEVSNSNISYLTCLATIHHNQNLKLDTSLEGDDTFFNLKDSTSKLLRPIHKYKINTAGPVEKISVYKRNLSKPKLHTPLPTVRTPVSEINEKISKPKITVDEEFTLMRGRKCSKIREECLDSISINSITLPQQNDLDTKDLLTQNDKEALKYNLIPRVTEHNNDDCNKVNLAKLSKFMNSTSTDLIANNNINSKLEDMEETNITIEKNSDYQKFDEIPNSKVQMNEMPGSPIISITNTKTRHSIACKQITNNVEIVKSVESGNEITENIVETKNILKHRSASFNKLQEINSSERTEEKENTTVNRKITYLAKTLKPCKVTVMREDLVKKLHQIKNALKEQNYDDFPNDHDSFKRKNIKVVNDSLNGAIQDKTASHTVDYFFKKRKYEVNRNIDDQTYTKRPKINIISDIKIVSGTEKSNKRTNCRKLCNINDLSHMEQRNSQSKENESYLNLNKIDVVGCNKKENETSIFKMRNLSQDSYLNFQKPETVFQKERQSSIEKEKYKKYFPSELFKSGCESPKTSTPHWLKSKKKKEPPSHKLQLNFKRIRKTVGEKKDFDYSKEEKITDTKVNRAALKSNMNQNIEVGEHDTLEPVKERNNNDIRISLSDITNDVNNTERNEALSGNCASTKKTQSWIATDSAEDMEEILKKVKKLLKFTKDITGEALEILKGPISASRQPLYDLTYLINTELDNYYRKCDNTEINEVVGSNFNLKI